MSLVREIFSKIGPLPDDEPKYPPEALQPLAEIPGLWAQVLSELYTLDSACGLHRYMQLCMSIALYQALLAADDEVWDIITKTGFLSVLASFVPSVYLCGFTKEQLESSDVQDDTLIMNFIVWTFAILFAYFNRVAATYCPIDFAYIEMLDNFQTALPPIYERLWEVKDTFLTCELACSDDPELVYVSIHGFIELLGAAVIKALRKHRQIVFDEKNSKIPHVLLTVWVHNASRIIRMNSLRHFTSVVGDGPYDAFFRSFAHGYTGHEYITLALIRDLQDETVVDADLLEIFLFAIVRDTVHDEKTTPPITWSDMGLGRYTIAAAHRQICLGAGDDKAEAEILFTAFSVIKRSDSEPLASNSDVCGFVGLLCHYAMLQIGREDSEARDQLNKVVSWWIQHLLPLEDDDRPKVAVMRRQTLDAWKEITEELTRRRVLAHNVHWRVFAVLWKAVENLIPYPEDVNESPFPLLQRCGWRECLCSVHKPAHRLRVCKGCWLVAYCGSRCQMMDWEEGGHKQRCRKRVR